MKTTVTISCPNGHLFDGNIHGRICPICNVLCPQPEENPAQSQARAEEAEANLHAAASGEGSSEDPTQIMGTMGKVKPAGSAEEKTEIVHPHNGSQAPETAAEGGSEHAGSQRRLVGMLISYSGNSMGSIYRITEGRNVVGRGKECDIVFPNDTKMSEKHFVILHVPAEGITWVEDLASTNGTYLNGTFTRGLTALKNNDIIEAGGSRMIYQEAPKEI